MKSYTTLLARAKKWVQKSDSTTESDLAEYINDGHKHVCGLRDWDWLKDSFTTLTVASQEAYNYPAYSDKPNSVTVTVSTTKHSPTEIHSQDEWDRITSATTGNASDTPIHWFATNGQIKLFPIPATSSNTITINAKVTIKDLSIADYSTGSVQAVTNGSTTVTGTGTSWATSMAGRWIRITESDTANKGDGQWYKIASVASTTSLTLTRAYAGTSISAGTAAYVIGQMPLIPENYQLIPAYWAAAEYWRHNDTDRATTYANQYTDLLGQLISAHSSKTSSPVIFRSKRTPILNPNLFPIVT